MTAGQECARTIARRLCPLEPIFETCVQRAYLGLTLVGLFHDATTTTSTLCDDRRTIVECRCRALTQCSLRKDLYAFDFRRKLAGCRATCEQAHPEPRKNCAQTAGPRTICHDREPADGTLPPRQRRTLPPDRRGAAFAQRACGPHRAVARALRHARPVALRAARPVGAEPRRSEHLARAQPALARACRAGDGNAVRADRADAKPGRAVRLDWHRHPFDRRR